MTLGLEVQLLIESKKNARTNSTSWNTIFLAEKVVCGIFFSAGINAKHGQWEDKIMKSWCLGTCKTFSNYITKVQVLLYSRSAYLFWIWECCMHFTLAWNAAVSQCRQDGQANVRNKLMMGSVNYLNPLYFTFSCITPVALTPDFRLEMKRSLLSGACSSSMIFYQFPTYLCCKNLLVLSGNMAWKKTHKIWWKRTSGETGMRKNHQCRMISVCLVLNIRWGCLFKRRISFV